MSAAPLTPIAGRLLETTQEMASFASVEFGLWNRHSNLCLQIVASHDKLVEALEVIFDAEEAVADVEEYDLEPTLKKRLSAHKKRAAAWKKGRAALAAAKEQP